MSTVANIEKLNASIQAAEKFLQSARQVKDMKLKADLKACPYTGPGPKQTGQLRRDSLNLTRSLAELRNPRIDP